MSSAQVYAVTGRDGKVIARHTSREPITHACAVMRWDGRVAVRGWGDRAAAHASKARALKQVENKAAVVVGVVVERRPLR